MTEADNIGTVRERKRRQRYWALVLALVLIGGALGAADIFDDPNAPIVPGLAIALSLGLTLLLIGGNWLYRRYVDELEWANNVVASFWGFNAFALGYPVWLLLWKGRLVPEPDILTLYFIAIGTAAVVYFWKRFR
jgi:hypothetical protein